VTKLKDNHDQIIDHERITHILKTVQIKAKKNKLDSDVVTRIWQIFIQEAIKLEYAKVKKN
jgi:chorismate mutase